MTGILCLGTTELPVLSIDGQHPAVITACYSQQSSPVFSTEGYYHCSCHFHTHTLCLGQNDRAILGDCDGIFKVSRGLAILRHHSPLILQNPDWGVPMLIMGSMAMTIPGTRRVP